MNMYGNRLRSPIFLSLSIAGTAIGAFVLLKGGSKYEGKENLEGTTAIVTGCNTGIGKEVARELARRGARVVMACRDLEKCELARRQIVLDTLNKEVVCRHLDLASMKSIHKFADHFNQTEKQLNILINNAGVMRCPRMLTEDGFELQLGVNHLGHFLLTQLLIEKLKSSRPARIVNVTGSAHAHGTINFEDLNSDASYDPGSAYNQSKLANVLFTKTLAEKLKGTGIPVYAVYPGIVFTELIRHMPISNSYLAKIFAMPILWMMAKSPRQGAIGILDCALTDENELESGAYYSNREETRQSPEGEDATAARKLWLISEKWTRIHNI